MTTHSIRAGGLCKRFGELEVLRGVSLELPMAGVTALTGPSGCGKTTLLMILAGLLEPDAGCMQAVPDLRRAMVFQEDRLLEGAAARYNVELVLRGTRAARTETALRALHRVGLEEAAARRAGELSGGMKRRVALARALAALDGYNSGLLLLDEPFSGLDDDTRAHILETLRETARDAALLIVTHDHRDAEELGAGQVIQLG